MIEVKTKLFDRIRLIAGRPLLQSEVDAINAILDGSPEGIVHKLVNPPAFFDAVRSGFHKLTVPQVEGFETLLAAFGVAGWGAGWVANALATAWLETNETMKPVREAYWLSEEWRKRNLRYYPWYGRGYVQLTWEKNYTRADTELGLGGKLLAAPDLAMEPANAARIMVAGMSEGWFTGKKLSDYIPAGGEGAADQHKQARRIINGTDRWDDLTAFAMKFQDALEAGKWA